MRRIRRTVSLHQMQVAFRAGVALFLLLQLLLIVQFVDPESALAHYLFSTPLEVVDNSYIHATVILSGVGKDIKPAQIHSIVPKLRALGRTFQRYHIIIYENNSNEQSRAAWRAAFNASWDVSGVSSSSSLLLPTVTKNGTSTRTNGADYTFISENTPSAGGRTHNIAAARNKLLRAVREHSRKNQQYYDYDYWITTDLDGVCGGADPARTYSPSVLREAFDGTHAGKWDALSFSFAPYWDRWAFRHPLVMPYNMYGKNKSQNKIKSPADMQKWINSQNNTELVEVESAFMMMSIYRINMTEGCAYSGVDASGSSDCEHVAFHRDMRQRHGARVRLWPMPYCQGDEGFQEKYWLLDNRSGYVGIQTLTTNGSDPFKGLQAPTRSERPITKRAPPSASRDNATKSDQVKADLPLEEDNRIQPPYTRFAPKLDVVWSRGWYNAHLPPADVPISYYNEKGRTSTSKTSAAILRRWLLAAGGQNRSLCHGGNNETEYIWVRTGDLQGFVSSILPNLSQQSHCNITLISSDGLTDIPTGLPGANDILRASIIHAWYAQNVDRDHPKLHPIPLGLAVHDGFPGSPDSLDTVQTMERIRSDALQTPFRKRRRTVLFDKGTLGGKGTRRYNARYAAASALELCSSKSNSASSNTTYVEVMPRLSRTDAWRRYASHHFAIAPTGMGWDTHRLWELLFFGTVPVVLTSELDRLLIPTHVPVLVLSKWSEVCDLVNNATAYDAMLDRYEQWIGNARQWLRPDMWVPRDQNTMDKLCDESFGCNQAFADMKRMLHTSNN